MSQLLINNYLSELSRLKMVSGASRELVVREAFKDLLKAWGRSKKLTFIAEHEYVTLAKKRIYVDGALLHDLRVPLGYWEAKDEKDEKDAEIARKFCRAVIGRANHESVNAAQPLTGLDTRSHFVLDVQS